MNAPQLTSDNGNIIALNSPDPAIVHALNTFDLEKFVAKNPEMFSASLTGYPLLFHIMTCIMGHMQGKKILEIGGGVSYGLKNIRYLRKMTDTVDRDGKREHHAFGIDLRNGDAIVSEALEQPHNKKLNEEQRREALLDLEAVNTKAMRSCDWADIAELADNEGNVLTFDCIFNHRIGPNPSGYEKVTDAALNPGGFYIAFRDRESISPEPVDKKFFIDHEYYDGSFSFKFKEGITRENKKGYDVTIFRKPFESGKVMRGVQGGTDDILAR